MSLKRYLSESEIAANQPVTGDCFDINIKELTNIETTVLEHKNGSIVIGLDETAMKLLSEAGVTFDDEEEAEYFPAAGDVVRIDHPSEYNGKLGEVVEVAPSGNFAYVEFKNGAVESFHSSDMDKVSDEEAYAYFDDESEDDDFDESLGNISRLAGVSKVSEAPAFDQSPGSPYDRGKSDAYYGRKGNPTKVIDKPNATVKGERMIVKLTDPEEIKAYYAGYEGSEFGEKDYGSFPDTSDDIEEEVNIAEAQMGSYLGVSALRAPPTKQYRPAMWENMLGTVYAMDDAGKVEYFDYKHKDAIAFSGASDPGAEPRLYRVNRQAYGKPYGEYRYGGNDDYASPNHGKLVLWIKKAEYRKPKDDKPLNDIRKLAGVQKESFTDWPAHDVTSAHIEPSKQKNVVVTSPKGKVYTFDTEEEARKVFLDKWNVVKDPKSGWMVDVANTKIGETSAKMLDKMKNNDLYAYRRAAKAEHQAEMEKLRAEKEKSGKVAEAEYQGREVPLGKPMQGDVKKFKVYVKDPKTGNVKKVNFGDPNMRIKKSNPERRKSFRARHHCDNPGPRTKARYWSCRKW